MCNHCSANRELLKAKSERDWRAVSEVKSTGCSSKGPGFHSQHPHNSSQLSVTPVPRNSTLSYRHTCKHNIHSLKIKTNENFKREYIFLKKEKFV